MQRQSNGWSGIAVVELVRGSLVLVVLVVLVGVPVVGAPEVSLVLVALVVVVDVVSAEGSASGRTLHAAARSPQQATAKMEARGIMGDFN